MKKVFWLLICSILIVSCNNSRSQGNEREATEKVEASTQRASDLADSSHETIALNNGEKWTVNKEMSPYIQAGENLLATYVQTHSENYKELAAQLKEKNTELIKSCTMQGKSHEELHKWLHPHLELVSELEKANSEQQAQEIVEDLQHSFEMFHQYFQ